MFYVSNILTFIQYILALSLSTLVYLEIMLVNCTNASTNSNIN